MQDSGIEVSAFIDLRKPLHGNLSAFQVNPLLCSPISPRFLAATASNFQYDE